MKRFALWVLGVVLVAGMPAVAFADDGPIYTSVSGGSAQPRAESAVRMEAETVQVVMLETFAEYRCDFRFVNTGQRRTVLVGFPFSDPNSASPAQPVAFRAWRNGSEIPVEPVSGVDAGVDTRYYSQLIDFPTGATTVTVSYFAPSLMDPSNETTTTSDDFPGDVGYAQHYDYTLHSGAPWAGPIGTAVVRFTASNDFYGWDIDHQTSLGSEVWLGESETPTVNKVATAYTLPEPNVRQWVFHDLEPTETADGYSPYDLQLAYLEPASPSDAGTEGGGSDFDIPSNSEATSALTVFGVDHTGDLAGDGDPSTSWAAGGQGDGTGQQLTFDFGPAEVHEIRVIPGNASSMEAFRQSGRPTALRVRFSDGTVQTITLADEPTLQRFAAAPSGSPTTATVTILGVKHGTLLPNAFISEIEFGDVSPRFENPGALLHQAGFRAAPLPPGSAGAVPAAAATHRARRATDSAVAVFLVLAAAILIGDRAVTHARQRKAEPAEPQPDSAS